MITLVQYGRRFAQCLNGDQNFLGCCQTTHDTGKLSDKLFWIVNRTADVNAVDVFWTADPTPLVNTQTCSDTISPTWDGWEDRFRAQGCYGNYAYGTKFLDGVYDPSDKTTRFSHYPSNFLFPRSQCLAVSFNVNDSRSLLSGPSGVFCSSADFGSLYRHVDRAIQPGGACCTFWNYGSYSKDLSGCNNWCSPLGKYVETRSECAGKVPTTNVL